MQITAMLILQNTSLALRNQLRGGQRGGEERGIGAGEGKGGGRKGEGDSKRK